MVLRKPNLLDAFQASAPEGRKAPARSGGGVAAGPFASEGLKGPAGIVMPEPKRSWWARFSSDRTVQFALVVALLAIGIAFWIGHQSGSGNESLAQNTGENGGGTMLPEKTPVSNEPDPADANQRTAAAGTTHDEQFLDPANRFTVRVASFAADEAGKRAALEHRDYLRGEGAPVIQPIAKGRILVLCVGHEASMDSAQKLLNYVKGLRGPKSAKKAPYADAYIDNIDNVVTRKK